MNILLLLFVISNLITNFVDARAATKIKPNERCTSGNCRLPDCFCSSLDIPGGFQPKDIPQIVYLTFDGAHTVATTDLYSKIFDGRKNPNGQSISGTFFINHDYNDYTLTHRYWREGHDIALNSISKTTSTYYWQNLDEAGWIKEIADQRALVAKFAKIPEDDIHGCRAPYLQGGGDSMYSALYKSGFRYESSRPTRTLRPVLWPYTADHDSIQDCQIQPCPTGSYPGFWVSPLVDLVGSSGFPCAMVDSCLDPPASADEMFNLLYNNFQDHYTSNRAPFGVYAHPGYLNNDSVWILEGYLKFVEFVLSLGDTYIVSIDKGLDWVQQPARWADLDALPASWQPAPVKSNNCPFAFSCNYDSSSLPPQFPGQSRTMSSCVVCPPKYPWLDNPFGQA